VYAFVALLCLALIAVARFEELKAHPTSGGEDVDDREPTLAELGVERGAPVLMVDGRSVALPSCAGLAPLPGSVVLSVPLNAQIEREHVAEATACLSGAASKVSVSLR
jgi:hypothetical protein